MYPVTARRWRAIVSAGAGYEVTRLAMLDMFPHAGHLESMVLFERVNDYRLTDFGWS